MLEPHSSSSSHMRICILEWLCCGGMHAIDPQLVPSGLRNEGWAMLECLSRSFHDAGHQVYTLIDRRMVGDPSWTALQPVTHSLQDVQSMLEPSNRPADDFKNTLRTWIGVSQHCDLTIVIAPESGGILQKCIQRLTKAGVPLLNCSGQFLEACCDKLLTAIFLAASDIPHPLTFAADGWDDVHLGYSDQWCLKPRQGCGCEGLVVSDANLIDWICKSDSDQHAMIVQEWIEGKPFSCSAIVDSRGKARWSPLVTQEFKRSYGVPSGMLAEASPQDDDLPGSGVALEDDLSVEDEMFGGTDLPPVASPFSLSYIGAKLAPKSIQRLKPVALLNATLKALAGKRTSDSRLPGALGWIGVDLVLDENDDWFVIEVNSRLTTSVCLLADSTPTNIANLMLGND